MPPYVTTNRLGSIVAPSRPNERREIYPHPNQDAVATRNATYEQMFAYYSNTAFDDVAVWARYRLRHNLYRFTRPIFNPFTRVVDFYVEHVYPGALSVDGQVNPRSAIPFAYSTPEEIRKVAGQMWQWSNWQNGQSLMVQTGAITGNVYVDVVDDVEKGKIRYQVFFPTAVREIELDPYGNVEAVVLEYFTSDPKIDNGRVFKYAKEMNKEWFAYYKDGELYDYGNGKVIENPYGFVPGVWARHTEIIGSDYGIPAMRSSLAKIDELNSIVSHTADHIHKQIESPRIIFDNSTIKPLFGSDADFTDFDSRQQQVLLKGTAGGTTETLVGTLDPQTIVPIVEKIIAEIEADYPEITMYEKLREQNIVTAPGAQRLMGDVARKMSRPAANYDKANEKLIQMGAAIGGMRVNNGDWGSNLSPQQEKFRPFDLSSYNRGELDFTILERELTPQTSREEADELQVRASAVAAAGDAVPAEEKLRMLGKREEEIPELLRKLEEEQKRKAEQAVQLAQATKPPAGSGDEGGRP